MVKPNPDGNGRAIGLSTLDAGVGDAKKRRKKKRRRKKMMMMMKKRPTNKSELKQNKNEKLNTSRRADEISKFAKKKNKNVYQ
jgi:hypothetical protein